MTYLFLFLQPFYIFLLFLRHGIAACPERSGRNGGYCGQPRHEVRRSVKPSSGTRKADAACSTGEAACEILIEPDSTCWYAALPLFSPCFFQTFLLFFSLPQVQSSCAFYTATAPRPATSQARLLRLRDVPLRSGAEEWRDGCRVSVPRSMCVCVCVCVCEKATHAVARPCSADHVLSLLLCPASLHNRFRSPLATPPVA